jgi:hypothetical protein
MLVSCKAMQQVSRRISVAGIETRGRDINLYSDFKYVFSLVTLVKTLYECGKRLMDIAAGVKAQALNH